MPAHLHEMSSLTKRLALGTAQFGLRYGIANQAGPVSRDEAGAILHLAAAAGIDTLDTAMAYGASERVLGAAGVGRWRVISKLPAVEESGTDMAAWVRTSIGGSLERLGVPRLHALLLHQPHQLLGAQGDALYNGLVASKAEGLADKIGVSIYDPEQLDTLRAHHRLDVVQAPFNILDRRLASSGWMDRLHDAGIEIHVRSIFLQGLLVLPAEQRPVAFDRWGPVWQEWHAWLSQHGMSPVQACLAFVLGHSKIDRVIIGFDSVAQLKDVLAAPCDPSVRPPGTLVSDDADLINPSRWRSL